MYCVASEKPKSVVGLVGVWVRFELESFDSSEVREEARERERE